MSEPAADVIAGYLCKGVPQGGPQFARRAGLARAQNRLELGEALFNRIEVRRVRRQLLPGRPRRFAPGDGRLMVVKPHVIQEHPGAAGQGGSEQRLTVQLEDLTVAGPFTAQRGQETVPREGADNRNIRALLHRLCDRRALPGQECGSWQC